VGTTFPILTYWYFHLPNFVLAALMYTLLGRALLSLFLDPDSSNYIWRFLPDHRSDCRGGRTRDA